MTMIILNLKKTCSMNFYYPQGKLSVYKTKQLVIVRINVCNRCFVNLHPCSKKYEMIFSIQKFNSAQQFKTRIKLE